MDHNSEDKPGKHLLFGAGIGLGIIILGAFLCLIFIACIVAALYFYFEA
jgi:4-amino-4-deoxy-L-arabinose transferase-like glycosyltransferase